jgi:endonuclease/exonuclease/phosphatase family metal-dependent hydrolase
MTFNIRQGRALDGANRWYKRRDLVFEVIRRYRPHLLGLQEAHHLQLAEILSALDGYGSVAQRRYGGRFGAFAPILFDRERLEAGRSGDFWLAPEPDGHRRRGWDAAVARICTWAVLRDTGTDRRFAAFNTHVDHRGKQAQVHSARLLTERLGAVGDLPRLLLADLNANEQSEALAILLASGLRDTFRVVRGDEEPFFTYHRFDGARAGGRLGKIDFILCDDRWTVCDAQIVRDEFEGRLPSDHYPVVATLALGDAEVS